MKTKQKIVIDKLFGTPAVYLINTFARFLGFILRINHSLTKNFETIVIAKYVGLGSIIQATPLIQTLRAKYPNAKIVFLTTIKNKDLLNHIPEIDTVIMVSDKTIFKIISTSFKALLTLWKIKPQLFIDLEFYSNYSSIITTLSKATNRLGFSKQGALYRKGVYNYLVNFNVNTPISKTYLQFAQLVNCNALITELKIIVNDAEWQYITKVFNISKNNKYIIINPNASDLRIERRWPKQNYIHIINKISQQYPNYKLILIGDKNELNYVNEIEKDISNKTNLINSAGKLTLTQLITLIGNAHLMLTNDTGPMHIAFATATKTVALFGPCSPLQYGGTINVATLYKKVHCSPCVHKYILPPCNGNNICLKQITIMEVYNEIFKLI